MWDPPSGAHITIRSRRLPASIRVWAWLAGGGCDASGSCMEACVEACMEVGIEGSSFHPLCLIHPSADFRGQVLSEQKSQLLESMYLRKRGLGAIKAQGSRWSKGASSSAKQQSVPASDASSVCPQAALFASRDEQSWRRTLSVTGRCFMQHVSLMFSIRD